MGDLASELTLSHRLRGDLLGVAMDTVDEFRVRYARTDDDDLRRLLAIEPATLTPEALQALGEEVERRGLRSAVDPPRPDPLDSIVWPAISAPRKYAKASLFGRFLAYLADGIIAFVPFTLSMFFIVFGFTRPTALRSLAALGLFLWAMYYFFAKDGFEGGSFGKRMFNLRVVNVETNRLCSKTESAVRALDLFLLQFFPVVGWLVEPLAAMTSKDGRRLGDRAAGTQVIESRDYIP